MAIRRRAQAERRIERRIYFYRARLQVQGNDDELEDLHDSRPLFRHIEGLDFDTADLAEGRYQPLPDGNLVAMLNPHRTTLGVRGILGTVRRSALPDIERLGILRGLPLPVDTGLFEGTHFVLFLPQHILGMEFNVFGPRASRLERYLMDKGHDFVDRVSFLPILRRDVEERLREIGEVSLIRIAVRADETEIVRRLNASLADAFTAALQVGDDPNVGIVEIVLRKWPYSRQRRFRLPFPRQSVVPFVTDRESREALDAFEVKAENTRTHATEVFDLLEDRFVASRRVSIVGGRRRSIRSAEMFQAIEEEFRAHEEELVRFTREVD